MEEVESTPRIAVAKATVQKEKGVEMVDIEECFNELRQQRREW